MVIWIYAEWCGHCHAFLPTWRELVKGYSQASSVDFVMINGDSEAFMVEYPEEYPMVEGFPTIWMIHPGETIPRKYRNARTTETLEAYISEM